MRPAGAGPRFQQAAHSLKENFMSVDLFPDELRGAVPPLRSQEGIDDPIIVAKFLTRDANWLWYVSEGSPDEDDFIFFGLVIGLEEEWGQFSLSELAEVRGPSGFPIERDLHFERDRLRRILAREHRLTRLNMHLGE